MEEDVRGRWREGGRVQGEGLYVGCYSSDI